MIPRWAIVVGGLVLLAVLVIAMVVTASVTAWWVNREQAEEGPALIEEPEMVLDQPTAPPSGIDRVIYVESQPVRVGEVPGAAKEDVAKFAESVKDTTKPKRYADTRASWRDDRLILTVARSDGAMVRREFECPAPTGCDAWANDTLIGSSRHRAAFRFWPELGKGIAKCGIATGIGYGAGLAIREWVNEEVSPWVPAGGAGIVCTVIEITP